MKNLTKKGFALLMCLCLVCGMFSIGVATLALPSPDKMPVHYELYSYYEDVNTAVADKTSVNSDSPWSVGFKIGENWLSANTFSKIVKSKYIYAFVDGHKVSNFPSFAYYYPNNYAEGDPLFHSLIAPSNVTGDTAGQYKIDMSYAFTTQLDGKYSFGKSDQTLILSDAANYFSQENKTANIDFGVKITLNGEAFWPTSDDSFYKDGWAVFGSKDATVEKIEIPTFENLELVRGDVFRIEFTSFTPAALNKLAAQQITGSFRMSMTELGDTSSLIEIKNRYELYDYFEVIRNHYDNDAQLLNTSPWSAGCFYEGEWHEPNEFDSDAEYIYARCSDRNAWGVAYPGFGFYKKKDGARYQRAIIAPSNHSGNEAYVCNSAYIFTAPEKGTYSLHYSDPDSAVSFGDTQYFSSKTLGFTGIIFGVRITLNDEVIWPNASVYTAPMEDGFAQFGYDISGLPTSIAVPKLDNLGMQKKDILRVEFTSFSPISGEPWNQFVSGCLSMTKISNEIVKDETAPVFKDGQISLESSGSSYLKLVWPFATDEHSTAEQLTYSLFISETPFTEESALSAIGGQKVNSEGGTVMNLKSSTEYYTAVVCIDNSYNKSVLLGGPFATKEGVAADKTVYELYDYFDEISSQIQYDQQKVTIKETKSPWVAQYYDNVWVNLNRATRLGDLIYCNVTTPNWGGYYPGISFLSPLTATLKYQLARLNPAKTAPSVNTNFDYDTAFAFTAPYAGKYTLEKGLSEFASSATFDGKFAVADGASKDMTIGVRITLNGESIWPLENTDCTMVDGYATVIGFGTDTGSVEIPTIKNIPMIAGDVLRVEARAFDGSINTPWYQQVSANVRMILEEKTIDSEPPVFSEGAITSSAATLTSLTVNWPLAEDALSNAESIKYQLYYDEKSVTEETMSELEPLSVRGNSQRITLLESGKEYYVAIVATDIAGNSAMITGGPFTTEKKGGSGGNNQGGGSNNGGSGGSGDSSVSAPQSPLQPNMSAADCGIIASGGGSISIGWINSNSMSYYYAFLYSVENGNYRIADNSGNLGGNASQCKFYPATDGKYAVQVIGYNNRGEMFEIFPVIEFTNAKTGTSVSDTNNPNGGSNLKPNGSAGTSGTTTIIDQEGTTQIQDVYETVTNTTTTVTGPSVVEQVLWVVLLVFGGLMLLASAFLLFLLLKKPKQKTLAV